MDKLKYNSVEVGVKSIPEETQWKIVYAFLLAQFVFIPSVLYWFTKVFE